MILYIHIYVKYMYDYILYICVCMYPYSSLTKEIKEAHSLKKPVKSGQLNQKKVVKETKNR